VRFIHQDRNPISIPIDRDRRKATNYSYEPLTITTAKEKIYCITFPEQVSACYKNTKTLSWDEFLNTLMTGFGLTKDALELLWLRPEPGSPAWVDPYGINPLKKDLVHVIEDIYKAQLLPGDKLDRLRETILVLLDAECRWANMPKSAVDTPLCNISCKRIWLFPYCRTMMTNAATKSMFGDKVHQICPDITSHIMTVSDYAWMNVFGLPKFLSPTNQAALNTCLGILKQYLKIPQEEREEQECWAITMAIDAMRRHGMNEQSQAAILLMIWWA
jgi:hypothetical protein